MIEIKILICRLKIWLKRHQIAKVSNDNHPFSGFDLRSWTQDGWGIIELIGNDLNTSSSMVFELIKRKHTPYNYVLYLIDKL